MWTRSFVPVSTPRCERAIECARDLEAEGVLDCVEVGVWGREFAHTTLSQRVPQLEAIHRRLEAFEAWAETTDRDLEPFFTRRHVESEITGEQHVRWRLPVLALAEFDGDELVHVTPCTVGDRTVDVFDRLEALADGEFDGRDGHDGRLEADYRDRRVGEVISPTFDVEASDPDPRVEPSASGSN
ncbi:hypothetical protein B1756_16320 [Natrarchaeobaculum aegyptiacum]|uniref:Uncharacterized protein n=1 Tax=Natrarchaeobaculum aegyptiacum TaxID=745377 RepID=A0A2Z2HZF2_9EURY|nr:hypothetical protein B1756_16320 [Natrarchaeobaculum aegyptiacum]